MQPTFNHEKLIVFQRSLAFYAKVESIVTEWDSRHAISDHLPRAAESMVENIAQASAASSGMKQKALDCSLGSTLECAACLHIAEAKEITDGSFTRRHKEMLAEIFRMLIGVRKSWSAGTVRESRGEYRTGGASRDRTPLFHHERLDVYCVALEVVRWFHTAVAWEKLPSRLFRKLDAPLTSVVLNIAEGNGRFSELDHRRFLEIAYCSAINMAAQLDLCVHKKILSPEVAHNGKQLLVRVAGMTAVMVRGKRE
jgi:four helix bundle protein